jgi:hypothetical protein
MLNLDNLDVLCFLMVLGGLLLGLLGYLTLKPPAPADDRGS